MVASSKWLLLLQARGHQAPEPVLIHAAAFQPQGSLQLAYQQGLSLLLRAHSNIVRITSDCFYKDKLQTLQQHLQESLGQLPSAFLCCHVSMTELGRQTACSLSTKCYTAASP